MESRVRGLGLQLAKWELSSGNNKTFPTGVIISAFALRGRPVTLDSVAVKWVEWSSSVRLQSSQLQAYINIYCIYIPVSSVDSRLTSHDRTQLAPRLRAAFAIIWHRYVP